MPHSDPGVFASSSIIFTVIIKLSPVPDKAGHISGLSLLPSLQVQCLKTLRLKFDPIISQACTEKLQGAAAWSTASENYGVPPGTWSVILCKPSEVSNPRLSPATPNKSRKTAGHL
ncbi:hypothetical protein CDV36_002234 [Fusarium kuroshium]|uniref:Uncharacterized protein n=1 Tax=Fusarium kuroshium TaxID=2010991 RepID=A0A3M2SKP4_9HYPO|nr:hypothetical protein CDV36_002234 [Fusarium kuroshium]